MVERETKTFAIGLAAGAAAIAAGAGARAMFDGRDGHDKGHQHSEVPEAEYPDEETTGRGHPTGSPDAESLKNGFDVKDASVPALVKIMAFSVTLMVMSIVAIFYMFARFGHTYQAPNRELTAEQLAPIVPPLPHLQAVPYREIDATLMEQTQRLTTYGWNSSDHKTAHIPIERAIQQVIGKPLDGTAEADAAGPRGSTAPQLATPAYNADILQNKPGNRIQGEGNPNTVAPSYTPPQPETKP